MFFRFSRGIGSSSKSKYSEVLFISDPNFSELIVIRRFVSVNCRVDKDLSLASQDKTLTKFLIFSELDALFFTVHENRVDSIKKTILDNGGKVRFYLAYNTGHETGYQHITTSSLYDNLTPFYLLTPSSEDFQIVPYDIDLTSNDNNIMAAELAKLKFIVGLSMMYVEYAVNNVKVKTNLMLIMKLEGASHLDPSICYFTHNGIGRLFSIHSEFGSVSVGGINRKYGFFPVIGSKQIIGTYNEWSDDNNFFPPIRSNVFANWFGRRDQIFP